MDAFVKKRKAGDPAPTARPKRAAARKKKKPAADPEDDEGLARQAVVRADRLALENCVVALVADGTVSLARLAALGVAPAPPPKAAGPSVVDTSQLTATGGMGALEPLDAVTLTSILTHVKAPDMFSLSEVCKGLCALRREPRCWPRLDLGTLTSLTSSGLRRLPTSIPTSRVEQLRLVEPSRDSKFGSKDWVAFLKALECGASLRRLELGKQFGGGQQMLKAVEPLAKSVEALTINDLKAKCVSPFLTLVRNCPALRELIVGGSDITWENFLARVAQLAAVHRGAGAKSLLRKIEHIGWCYGPSTSMHFALAAIHREFPELEELKLQGIHANCLRIPEGTTAARLRVLSLTKVKFLPGGMIAHTTTLYGQQPAPQSNEALAAYFLTVERACPALEVWKTSRQREYISRKEQKERNWVYQPPPTLTGVAGARFPQLKDFSLGSIDVDATSFAGVEMPCLTTVTINVDGADFGGSFERRFPSKASREPILAPLIESSEEDVKVAVGGWSSRWQED